MRLFTSLVLLLSCARRITAAADGDSGTVGVTPHDSFSSSIGVLGCKVDTNRIAYWPDSPDCTNICVSLKYNGRHVNLLRIDQSQGAHDVSYDAWNYLYTGHSATDDPTAGGAIDMEFENVDASECADLIHTSGSKLPLSAANAMDFLVSCLEQPDSWVAKHYVLYNILDSICTLGYDETCTLDYPAQNQATCPHTLGLQTPLKSQPVYNIEYPSGDKVLATSGVTTAPPDSGDDEGSARTVTRPWATLVSILSIFFVVYM